MYTYMHTHMWRREELWCLSVCEIHFGGKVFALFIISSFAFFFLSIIRVACRWTDGRGVMVIWSRRCAAEVLSIFLVLLLLE